MKKHIVSALILPLIAVSLSACTSSEEVSKLEKRIQVLEQTNAELTKRLESQSSTSASASSSATADAGFADIAGAFGEKEIKDLQKLGVFNDVSGNFSPTKPITRAEFVCWLVRANNAMRPAAEHIRIAEDGASSSFTDLTSAQPYFKFIEGMNSAGWSIGYPDKTFKPEKALTREEMIAIKNPIDHGSGQYEGYEKKWTDHAKISENFKKYMSDEAFGDKNWSRVFGETKNCDPQKSVSRAEAAACIWQIGWHHKYQANKPEA
ncbi:MAG: S-layer homology domain-containing protein [Candidatus Obscuribacterales bacterium]|nr:S-layer homology domain-containing protein [Candidatus Obscuribacterales bacterium]